MPDSNYTVRLDEFSVGDYSRGRSKLTMAAWYIVSCVFISTRVPWPSGLKAAILRKFGARVGKKLVLRPRVHVHLPWRLSIGDHCWIGEASTILNLATVSIGDHTALAHEVYLAAAGHDIADPAMAYKHGPISIGTQCWIATRVYVGPGVAIGDGSVLLPCSAASSDLPSWQVCGGVPAKPLRPREVRGC